MDLVRKLILWKCPCKTALDSLRDCTIITGDVFCGKKKEQLIGQLEPESFASMAAALNNELARRTMYKFVS